VHVHRYEKLWLAASVLLIVGFIATVTYGALGLGITMVDDGDAIDPNALGDDDHFSEPRVEQTGDGEYDAYVIAQQFVFRPDPIVVPAGSEVTFHVTSMDVIHGFEVVGTNVNTMVIPGEVATFTVEFEEPAEYGIVCNEYCGAGHHAMEGQLQVVAPSEYGNGTGDGGAGASGSGGGTGASDSGGTGASGADRGADASGGDGA